MIEERIKYKVLMSLSFVGFIIAGLAGLADHVEWLQSACAGFTVGCKETAQFTLLRLPLWGWGMAFYAVLALSIHRMRRWLVWLVAGAVGFEVALTWIAISMKAMCVFCIANFFVVLLIVVFSFDRDHFWQTVAVSSLFFIFSIFSIPHENELIASTAARQHDRRVAAIVGGSVITEEELVAPIQTHVHRLEQEIYRLKRQHLDRMVTEKVLQKEADQRGITLDDLTREVILSAGVDVSDEEVNRYHRENLDRFQGWKGSDEELKSRIRASLQQNRSFQAVVNYAKSLNEKYEVSLHLEEPDIPILKVNMEESPSMGPPDAPVTVVEFSDYQCPACRQSHDVVRQVKQTYEGRIRWVFKDYPLRKHKDAAKAAEAARCAGDQGKFWEYQDILFAAQDQLTGERMGDYAAELGLDRSQFVQCTQSGKYKERVEQDREEGKRIGVSATPTFIIGGKLVSGGISLERFTELIEQELKH